MADETKTLSGSEAATAARGAELAPQLWMMITTFFHSPGRNILISLGVALCVVVALTASSRSSSMPGTSRFTMRCRART